MRINPDITTQAIQRYTREVRQHQTVSESVDLRDRVDISDRARLYSDLIQAAKDSEPVSMPRVHAIMNRIASGSYRMDMEQLADRMLGRG